MAGLVGRTGRSAGLALAYMGAVIGAGFASGQELMCFFVPFGGMGLLGALLAGVMFAFLGHMILGLAGRHRLGSYQELLTLLFGPWLGRIYDLGLTLFLFGGLVVMLAGSGTIFSEHLGYPFSLGILLTLAVLVPAAAAGGGGVLWLNNLLVPLLLGAAVFTAIGAFSLEVSPPTVNHLAINRLVGQQWWFGVILYVAYNIALSAALLVGLAHHQSGESRGVIIGGLALGVLAFFLSLSLWRHFATAAHFQLPMLYLAGRIGTFCKYLYSLALWFAMLTTAVADVFGLAKRISCLRGLSYQAACLVLPVMALPFTCLGFANLVGKLYPLFGYASLALLPALFWQYCFGASHATPNSPGIPKE